MSARSHVGAARNSNHADTRRRRRLSEEAEYHDPNGSAFLAIIPYARDRDSIEAEFRSGQSKVPLLLFRAVGNRRSHQWRCWRFPIALSFLSAANAPNCGERYSILASREEVTVGHEASPGKQFFCAAEPEETSKCTRALNGESR